MLSDTLSALGSEGYWRNLPFVTYLKGACPLLALTGIALTVVAALAVVLRIRGKYRTNSNSASSALGFCWEKSNNAAVARLGQQREFRDIKDEHREMEEGLRRPSGNGDLTSSEGSAGPRLSSNVSGREREGAHSAENLIAIGHYGVAKSFAGFAPHYMMPRPLPPPPLTPPQLSETIFTLGHGRQGRARTLPELETSFFDQPNPDYMTSTNIISQTTATSTAQSSLTPRRRSYTKTIPIGTGSSAITSRHTFDSTTANSLTTSYPPRPSPLSALPSNFGEMEILDSPSEIEVHGEIISALDDAGAGWKRHTRVYGGGVCLACAASGTQGHGGFYGHNVPPEDRR